MQYLSKPFTKGSEVNRDFFTDKVLGSKNYKGTTKEDFANDDCKPTRKYLWRLYERQTIWKN